MHRNSSGACLNSFIYRGGTFGFVVTTPRRASNLLSQSIYSSELVSVRANSINAPAPPPDYKDENAEESPYRSVLGLIPHQLRGFLAQFRTLPIVGAAYDKCTGCSETVSSDRNENNTNILPRK